MRPRPHRVVVWSTGGVGSNAIRAIADRPDLDLVGVWVHTPTKVGRDAGELAGTSPLGVAASGDADALEPDCVVYAASGPERGAGAAPDYERLLGAGINVVTTTSTELVYPPLADAGLCERLGKVSIEGDPDIECRLTLGPREGHDAGEAAMTATAMRVVNAVPYVVDAAPGLLSSLDLPPTLPRAPFRP